MRIVKEAEERKNEMLDAAEILFAEKGYEDASTNDILKMVGIARGTLYYHFKSKTDIMDAIISRYTNQMLQRARKVALDKSIPVEERIIQTVKALKPMSSESGTREGKKEMMRQLHKPQNALMHQKLQKILVESVPPILAGILKDGIEQGIVYTPYPLECMEMVMIYLNEAFDEEAQMTLEQQMIKIKAFIYHFEKMLGVENGKLAYLIKIFGEY